MQLDELAQRMGGMARLAQLEPARDCLLVTTQTCPSCRRFDATTRRDLVDALHARGWRVHAVDASDASSAERALLWYTDHAKVPALVTAGRSCLATDASTTAASPRYYHSVSANDAATQLLPPRAHDAARVAIARVEP